MICNCIHNSWYEMLLNYLCWTFSIPHIFCIQTTSFVVYCSFYSFLSIIQVSAPRNIKLRHYELVSQLYSYKKQQKFVHNDNLLYIHIIIYMKRSLGTQYLMYVHFPPLWSFSFMIERSCNFTSLFYFGVKSTTH